jgi:membrane protein DedA with SNARE-associated domain
MHGRRELEEHLKQLVSSYSYWAVALVVGLESMGIPLPGETILVLAAIYAAADPALNIWMVIAAATIGSIIGDNAGYYIGKHYAYTLLVRYGHRIGLSSTRIKVGQYLFRRHGGKVVFFGRFVALLRILAAFLAGVNHMPWPSFLIANAAGAVLWATSFGVGGYFFGVLLLKLHHSLAVVVFVLALGAFFLVGFLINRHEVRLIEAAERAFPGDLTGIVSDDGNRGTGLSSEPTEPGLKRFDD